MIWRRSYLKHRHRRASLSTWAIAALLAVSAAAVVIGALTDRFDNWAPNIATEALFVAVVVGVLDRIIEREKGERLRPRLDRVEEIVATGLGQALEAIAYDYAHAHP